MKSYRSSVHICDAAQLCRVHIVPGQSDQSCLGVGCILHLGFVTRPKRSTCTDGIRHYCHVLAQYILPMAKVFLATRKESVPPSKLAPLLSFITTVACSPSSRQSAGCRALHTHIHTYIHYVRDKCCNEMNWKQTHFWMYDVLLDRERQLRRGNTFLSSFEKNLCNRQY